jgi:tRNA dimethylallyltransferase
VDSAQPIVVIAGPTASGKTELAIDMAQKFNGEIICADSRTAYKEMDVGTAKPTQKQREAVVHYGLDLLSPEETFSAAEFKKYAREAISRIQKKGKIPLIVGGSGLYIDGLVYNYQFAGKPSAELRHKLNCMSLSELQTRAASLGIKESTVNFKNPRHLARAIERGGEVVSKSALDEKILYLGIKVDKKTLDNRLQRRVDSMIKQGLIGEGKSLINKYGPGAPGLLAPGYKAFAGYIAGEYGVDEARKQFIKSDKALAKRQMTWFKRSEDIKWIENNQEIEQTIKDFLAKFDTITT